MAADYGICCSELSCIYKYCCWPTRIIVLLLEVDYLISCNYAVRKFLFITDILSALFCSRSMHRNKSGALNKVADLDRFARSASAVRILANIIFLGTSYLKTFYIYWSSLL